MEAWALGRRAVTCTGMERGWDYQNHTQDRTGACNPIFIHQSEYRSVSQIFPSLLPAKRLLHHHYHRRGC